MFPRLRGLHLYWVDVTSDDLKALITSAKVTLTSLKLSAVALALRSLAAADDDLDPGAVNTSNSPTGANFEDKHALLWKNLWDFLRDELSLQRFAMAKIAFGVKQILIQGPEGPDGSPKPSEHAAFDAEMAGISFSEWINRLTPVSSNTSSTSWKHPQCFLED